MPSYTTIDLARAEGYAAMNDRLIGCLGAASVQEPREASVAYLQGMLARLDSTRASIVDAISKVQDSIERQRHSESA